eukprot:TRINITY_DN2757_c0_g1_i1.p1 TRINITY_DN2757_c0_g1~~TRINITY_DN2757_c0_g1_i1.p1  ORF type:complete len:311 (+),score=91.19 TRINITY_DN2757_c0_g1_i1:62-994(+)
MKTAATVLALVASSQAGGVPVVEGVPRAPDAGKLPTVTAHGMGDSCFNAGMKSITEAIGNATGSYANCVATGKDDFIDTVNGFFMTMDENVEIFAEKIKKDPKLAGGFNAVGFSQGNSIIRGYIHKYNDPPVKTFLSVHGTVMGVAGFPNCNPDGLLAPVCRRLDNDLGDEAYTNCTQRTLFQANYYRDPMRVNTPEYKEFSALAQWNGEGNHFQPEWKDNFVKVERFAMIKALKDTMVYPNDGEWWGQFRPGSYTFKEQMNETDYYKRDLFGLKTVDEAGKIVYNHTDGNHLVFTVQQLQWWVLNYFLE